MTSIKRREQGQEWSKFAISKNPKCGRQNPGYMRRHETETSAMPWNIPFSFNLQHHVEIVGGNVDSPCGRIKWQARRCMYVVASRYGKHVGSICITVGTFQADYARNWRAFYKWPQVKFVLFHSPSEHNHIKRNRVRPRNYRNNTGWYGSYFRLHHYPAMLRSFGPT